ncbi:MAG: GNAT family N-acetyltransferase [Eubacteriales bacterium]
MEIHIKKMTPALVEDYFKFFDEIAFADHPEWGCDCYCCFYHAVSADEWEAQTGAQNKARAREMILAGKLTGLLAYADGLPVAWCHYEKKDLLPGIRTFYPEFLDDGIGIAADIDTATGKSTAAIVCFTVAQGYRQKGIASRMLDFACRELAQTGTAIIEAYPTKASDSDEHNYHGPLSMYLSHGFTVYKELEGNTIVRKVVQDL